MILKSCSGVFLVVQWSRLYTFTAGNTGLIPGLGIKILHAMQHSKKIFLIKIKIKKVVSSYLQCTFTILLTTCQIYIYI